MTTPIHDALAARDAAFADLDAADWKQETKDIVAAILETAAAKPTFSANDCRHLLPEDVNPHRVGRAFSLAQERGWIRVINLVRSNAASTRGHHIYRYELVLTPQEVAA